MASTPETIQFDPASHTYQDAAGRIIPGVTSVLQAAGMIDRSWFTDAAAQRGTYVHTLTAMHDDGLIDETMTIPAEYVGYLNAWIRFRSESGFEPALIEHRVFHPVYFFAGTLDRTGEINRKLAVLDIKTGTASPATGPQTAAYAGCLEPAHARFAVELHDDGAYKLIEYRDPRDWNVWLAALQVYQWRTRHHVNI